MAHIAILYSHEIINARRIFFRGMLTCALRAQDKLSKNRNIAFNEIKNLMLR
jgi:hypothetical protein